MSRLQWVSAISLCSHAHRTCQFQSRTKSGSLLCSVRLDVDIEMPDSVTPTRTKLIDEILLLPSNHDSNEIGYNLYDGYEVLKSKTTPTCKVVSVVDDFGAFWLRHVIVKQLIYYLRQLTSIVLFTFNQNLLHDYRLVMIKEPTTELQNNKLIVNTHECRSLSQMKHTPYCERVGRQKMTWIGFFNFTIKNVNLFSVCSNSIYYSIK